MAKIEPWQLPETPKVADVAEVRRIGARTSRMRTSDQTAAAIFWGAPPLVPWMAAASEAARLARLDARHVKMRVAIAVDHARRMALRIGERLRYPTPQALIRGHAPSRIAAMHVDPHWEPLLSANLRSEAPCAECVAAGAVVATLRALLDDDRLALEATFPPACGVVRRFRTLTEMLQECEDAQVWAGLHLRATVVESTELGLRLARGRLPATTSARNN